MRTWEEDLTFPRGPFPPRRTVEGGVAFTAAQDDFAFASVVTLPPLPAPKPQPEPTVEVELDLEQPASDSSGGGRSKRQRKQKDQKKRGLFRRKTATPEATETVTEAVTGTVAPVIEEPPVESVAQPAIVDESAIETELVSGSPAERSERTRPTKRRRISRKPQPEPEPIEAEAPVESPVESPAAPAVAPAAEAVAATRATPEPGPTPEPIGEPSPGLAPIIGTRRRATPTTTQQTEKPEQTAAPVEPVEAEAPVADESAETVEPTEAVEAVEAVEVEEAAEVEAPAEPVAELTSADIVQPHKTAEATGSPEVLALVTEPPPAKEESPVDTWLKRSRALAGAHAAPTSAEAAGWSTPAGPGAGELPPLNGTDWWGEEPGQSGSQPSSPGGEPGNVDVEEADTGHDPEEAEEEAPKGRRARRKAAKAKAADAKAAKRRRKSRKGAPVDASDDQPETFVPSFGFAAHPEYDVKWAAAAHWATIPLVWVGLGFIGPFVVLVARGDQSQFVRDHATRSLNFQLSLLIYMLLGGFLGMFSPLLFLVPLAIGAAGATAAWFAGKAAKESREPRYLGALPIF